MASDGCSGGLDALARLVNVFRNGFTPSPWQGWRRVRPWLRESAGVLRARWQSAHPLSFTGCCDEHDLFYEEGTPWQGRPLFWPWLRGRIADIPWRAKADRLLRECVAANLKKRGRSRWVQAHVPWCVCFFVRAGGWYCWGKE